MCDHQEAKGDIVRRSSPGRVWGSSSSLWWWSLLSLVVDNDETLSLSPTAAFRRIELGDG